MGKFPHRFSDLATRSGRHFLLSHQQHPGEMVGYDFLQQFGIHFFAPAPAQVSERKNVLEGEDQRFYGRALSARGDVGRIIPLLF